jgi:hypothetical protein
MYIEFVVYELTNVIVNNMDDPRNLLKNKLKNKLSGMRLSRKPKVQREQQIDLDFKSLGLNRDKLSDAITLLSKCNKNELENLAYKMEETLTHKQREYLSKIGNSDIPLLNSLKNQMEQTEISSQQVKVSQGTMSQPEISSQQVKVSQGTMSQPDSGLLKKLTSQEQTVVEKMLSRSS